MMNFTKKQRAREQGICRSCEDYPTCKLQMRGDKPVFFCEEIPLAVSPRQASRGWQDIPAHSKVVEISAGKNEAARSLYLGLCRTCRKLTTCAFSKPGGGTWICEEYEAVM
jgi:hypothetical protein